METPKRLIFIGTLLLGVLFLLPEKSQAQNVLDGAYIREHNPTRKVLKYPHLREADVMWSKRVWRAIELKQKINHPLFYPIDEIEDRKSLFQVLVDAVLKDGSITAYSPGPTGQDDEFTIPLLPSEAEGMLSDTVKDQITTMSGMTKDTTYVEKIQSADVKKYTIKEDWFFDKQRSVMDVRIIGLAPWVEDKENGEVIGETLLFWFYYPECRYVLANHVAFNTQNNSKRRTFDDIFQKRRFDSYITQESNVYGDRPIISYKTGLDALLEAKSIKNEMFRLEHDLWSY